MGTKNLYENGPNPFFSFGTKILVRVKHMYGNGFVLVWFRLLLYAYCLCGGDTTMKPPNENSYQVFKTRRVMRYARADELELYSSSTTLPVKRRHQLMFRFYSCSRIVGG